MNKKEILWVILASLFLVVFNIVFFTICGFEHKASVWISYVFIHFAYFALLFTAKLIHPGKRDVIFGFSLYTVSAAYFLVELFVGSFFILLSLNGYKAALLIQLCIAGFYGIALTSKLLANEYTADVEEKREGEIEYVKRVSAKLQGLLESIADKEAKKKVERAYDAIYSSPVRSHPSLAQIEGDVLQSIRVLEDAVAAKNSSSITSLAGSLEAAINERNRLLKMCN
ncbi:MAG: hypothetical protein ACRC46_04230 [Thermoguttaceae bacterium]